jgi:serine/threonine protein kinase
MAYSEHLRFDSKIIRAARSDALTTLNSQTFLSRYEIEQEIGRGGMGTVYKIRDRLLNRNLGLNPIISFIYYYT